MYLNRHITGAVVGRQPFGGYGLSGVGSKAGGPDYLLQFLDPRVDHREHAAPGLRAGRVMDRMSAVADDEQRMTTANRQAAYVGLGAAVLAIVGAFLVWLTITIDGLSPPGSAQTGWDGGDGRTILVAGVAAAIASVAVLVGRPRPLGQGPVAHQWRDRRDHRHREHGRRRLEGARHPDAVRHSRPET